MTSAPLPPLDRKVSVMDFDATAQIVIVGAGGAGMMAALSAARSGATVLLLEKSVRRGCNTELSGGLVQGAGTRFQQALGIEDTPEAMMSDILGVNCGDADTEVLAAICVRSADVVHFLADVVGLDMHLDRSVLYVGHTRHRMHTSPGEKGSEVVAGLRRLIAATPEITLMDNADVRGLIVQDGAVTGVAVGDERIRAGAVLLSCDGYGNNRDMVREFCPEIADAVYIGSENNTGDGIRWGRDAGGELARMTAYQGHSHVNPKHGTRLGGSVPLLGAFIVNLDGNRFADENQGYSEFASVLLRERAGEAVEIFDQKIFDTVWQVGSFREAHEVGAVRRADTIEELAELFGLPAGSVRAALDGYNNGVASGADPMGRTDLTRPLPPPYYGARITGALVHTQGGLRIDPSTRVLRPDGSPIAGLYAAGGTATGISGSGPDGYMSGNGLIQAFATGLIAGEQMGAR
jgi:fumarate reductase flavoprotein subunit